MFRIGGETCQQITRKIRAFSAMGIFFGNAAQGNGAIPMKRMPVRGLASGAVAFFTPVAVATVQSAPGQFFWGIHVCHLHSLFSHLKACMALPVAKAYHREVDIWVSTSGGGIHRLMISGVFVLKQRAGSVIRGFSGCSPHRKRGSHTRQPWSALWREWSEPAFPVPARGPCPPG